METCWSEFSQISCCPPVCTVLHMKHPCSQDLSCTVVHCVCVCPKSISLKFHQMCHAIKNKQRSLYYIYTTHADMTVSKCCCKYSKNVAYYFLFYLIFFWIYRLSLAQLFVWACTTLQPHLRINLILFQFLSISLSLWNIWKNDKIMSTNYPHLCHTVSISEITSRSSFVTSKPDVQYKTGLMCLIINCPLNMLMEHCWVYHIPALRVGLHSAHT